MPFAIDEEAMKEAKSIDIAKPPVKQIPFEKFPALVYDHKRSRAGKIELKGDIEIHVPEKLVYKSVANEDELEAALKAGYSEKPPVFEEAVAEFVDELPRKGRK